MLIPNDDKSMDAEFHLRHKALYVEPQRQPIDWSKLPADGNEYIHRVRAEAESVLPNVDWGFCPAVVRELKAKSEAEGRHLLLPQWKRNEGHKFACLSSELARNRKQLMKKFPKRLEFPPFEDEKKVCLFLLGSKFYREMYLECVEETPGHPPLLSIVLYIEQQDIMTILRYLRHWCHAAESMTDDIGMWMYVLLACLQKPLSRRCETFLEELHDECIERNKGCEEKNQYHILEAALHHGFALKTHKITSILRRYSSLRYCK